MKLSSLISLDGAKIWTRATESDKKLPENLRWKWNFGDFCDQMRKNEEKKLWNSMEIVNFLRREPSECLFLRKSQ
jgi:hypothetical protein